MVSRDLPLTFWWQERTWYLKLAQRIQRLQEVVFIKDLLKIPPIFRYPKPSTTDYAIILPTSSKNSVVEISQFFHFQSCKMRHHLHFSWLFSTFFQFFPYATLLRDVWWTKKTILKKDSDVPKLHKLRTYLLTHVFFRWVRKCWLDSQKNETMMGLNRPPLVWCIRFQVALEASRDW